MIKKEILNLGFEVGCYTKKEYSKIDSKKIIENLTQEYTDVKVKGGYVEISTVDNEKDVIFLSEAEYNNRYSEKY